MADESLNPVVKAAYPRQLSRLWRRIFSRFLCQPTHRINCAIFATSASSFLPEIHFEASHPNKHQCKQMSLYQLIIKQNNYSALIKLYLGQQSITFFCTRPTQCQHIMVQSVDCRPNVDQRSADYRFQGSKVHMSRLIYTLRTHPSSCAASSEKPESVAWVRYSFRTTNLNCSRRLVMMV